MNRRTEMKYIFTSGLYVDRYKFSKAQNGLKTVPFDNQITMGLVLLGLKHIYKYGAKN